MSCISIKEFSEIRKSVTKRRKEIFDEMEAKKSISKKQCQQWIEDICDLIVAYDPILSLSSPSMQPFIKLVDIDPNNNKTSTTGSLNTSISVEVSSDQKKPSSSSTKENETEIVEINDTEEEIPIVAQSSATDNKETIARDGVRYKGVIRGIDSLKNNDNNCSDDDWSQDWSQLAQPLETPSKKLKTTRQTRSQSSKQDNNKTEDTNGWTAGGQVLGGNTSSDANSSLSPEERRRLLAEKSEQRLAKLSNRGAKGSVKLSNTAQADLPYDPKAKLQWKL